MSTRAGIGRHDPGLRAVARLRAVRERDSLLGLHQARREHDEREREVTELEASIRTHGASVSGDMGQFVALRHSLTALRHHVIAAREAEETARTVELDAASHWQADRTRLEAVNGLLERRAAERAADLDHRLATEQDEASARLWLHRTQEDS